MSGRPGRINVKLKLLYTTYWNLKEMLADYYKLVDMLAAVNYNSSSPMWYEGTKTRVGNKKPTQKKHKKTPPKNTTKSECT
jgi:hypothetical protein